MFQLLSVAVIHKESYFSSYLKNLWLYKKIASITLLGSIASGEHVKSYYSGISDVICQLNYIKMIVLHIVLFLYFYQISFSLKRFRAKGNRHSPLRSPLRAEATSKSQWCVGLISNNGLLFTFLLTIVLQLITTTTTSTILSYLK